MAVLALNNFLWIEILTAERLCSLGQRGCTGATLLQSLLLILLRICEFLSDYDCSTLVGFLVHFVLSIHSNND